MRKAAQYLRMSTDKQHYSLEAQKAAIGTYAENEGFEIIATYQDEARSGVTIARRDGLQTLLRDVLSGAPFATILVFDVSRWGRYQNPDQAAHYEFICLEAGVDIRYCADGITHDGSATSALLKSIKRVMAGEYSRQLSERCRAALRRHVMAGAKHGGVAPYGFSRQVFNADGSPGRVLTHGERRGTNQVVRLVPGVPGEIANVGLIFRLFVEEHIGHAAISKRLNSLNLLYREGSQWNPERVRRVLTNEIAVGRYVFNRTRCLFGNRESIPRSDWKSVLVTKPIIPRRLFAAAQSRIKALDGRIQTDAEMIQDLRDLLLREGHLTPRMLDRSKAVRGQKAYEKRFGSIQSAWDLVPYAGSIPRRRRLSPEGYSADAILDQLRVLLRENGYLSHRAIKAHPNLPSPKVIARKFGSVFNAYKLAGCALSQGELISAGRRRRKVAQPPG